RHRALGLPRLLTDHAVPLPWHALLGAIRRPSLRAGRRGAADVRLHRAGRRLDRVHPRGHRGRGLVTFTQLDGVGDAARLLPALLPARGRRGGADARGANLHCVLGRRPDGGGLPGPGGRFRAPGGPGRAWLRVGPDRRRVPARRADTHRELRGHDGRNGGRPRREPVCRPAGAVPVRRPRHRVDLERRRGRDGHVRGGPLSEPPDTPAGNKSREWTGLLTRRTRRGNGEDAEDEFKHLFSATFRSFSAPSALKRNALHDAGDQYSSASRRSLRNASMAGASVSTMASTVSPFSRASRSLRVPTRRSRAPSDRHASSLLLRRVASRATPSAYGFAARASVTFTRTPEHSWSLYLGSGASSAACGVNFVASSGKPGTASGASVALSAQCAPTRK